MVQKVLILASNPRGDLASVYQELDDLLGVLERHKGKFDVTSRSAPRPEQLPALFSERPSIIHFCGHGAGEQGLVLQNKSGQEQLVGTKLLVNLLEIFSEAIDCIVLNVCNSDCQARVLSEHIKYVVGMQQPILDQFAHIYAVGFYTALASGNSIEAAHRLGCWSIQEQETKSKRNVRAIYEKANRDIGFVGKEQQARQRPEYEKPVLFVKNKKSSSILTEANLTPSTESVEFIHDEIARRQYKDQSRRAYDEFGECTTQNATSPENLKRLTKSELEQRRLLVDRVEASWIEGVLNRSVKDFVPINLDLKARPDAIADLTRGTKTFPIELDKSYEQLRKTRVYDEIGQGRTLLILGEPGAGKTIALLQLTQRLIERRNSNKTLPMPVVFNLSSWKQDKEIVDWLIEELREKYQIPMSVSQSWISDHQLVLLLDGLDEVNQDYRNSCVQALNRFIGLYPRTYIAICSRVKDYEKLEERLQISSALCLQPLSSKHVYQVIDSVGGSLSGLKALLKDDRELEQFAKNPLILNMMSVAYQGWSTQALIAELRPNASRHQRIFNNYVTRRLARGTASEYSDDKVLHWLKWLASQMVRENQTVFLIEKIQPTWLQSEVQENLFFRNTVLLGGLMTASTALMHFPINGLNYVFLTGLCAGVSGTTFYAANTGKEIKITERLEWSWIAIRQNLFKGLLLGTLLGLVIGPVSGFVETAWNIPIYKQAIEREVASGKPISMPILSFIYGAFSALTYALIYGLTCDLKPSRIEKRKSIPNQGIYNSARNAIKVGVVDGACVGLIFWLTNKFLPLGESITWVGALKYGVTNGLIGMFFFGLVCSSGRACMQHLVVRTMLEKNDCIPKNYARFLDFASERLLVNKVGGGYVFFHRMLQENFARMKLQEKDGIV